MMHIIVIGPRYFYYSEGIVNAFREVGCRVDFFPILEFYNRCSWIQRKLYKIGFKALEKKWNRDWEFKLREFIAKHARSDTIFIFCTGSMISRDLLKDLHSYVKVLYMWDSVRRYPNAFQEKLSLYDYVFGFEYSDVEYVHEKYGVVMEYMPLGFDQDYFYPDDNIEKDIDVTFIGSQTKTRLELLEKVARFAKRNELKFFVAGKWYNNSWRKRRSFRKKNPYLAQYHHNTNLARMDVADVYRRSKIVLNINNDVHDSISPRTFEIMATRTFQLMNEGQNFTPLKVDGLENCIGLYKTHEDLIKKLSFYFDNEEICREKSAAAYCKIVDRFSQQNIAIRMLAKISKENHWRG